MTVGRSLSGLEQTELKRIEAFLSGMGCAYVIHLPDGTARGTASRRTAKPGGKKHLCEWGEYKIRQTLEGMTIGQGARFILLDRPHHTLQGLQKIVSGIGVMVFGKGCCKTTIHQNSKEVEVLCVDRKED